MKRIQRDPLKFDAFALFAKFLAQNTENLSLRDPNAVGKLLDAIRGPIEDLAKKDTFVFGNRTEALFQMVVGSLGKVALLRKEDEGEILYGTDEELIAPDFRIVLRDRSQFLVEVKNHYQKAGQEPHRQNNEYLNKLIAYAALMNVELLLATYWVRWSIWTLVPASAFVREGKYATLSLEDAMKRNEMARIGDIFIGTRWPLRFRIDVEELSRTEEGDRQDRTLVIKTVRLLSEDRPLLEEADRQVATALLLYGNWNESEHFETDEQGALTAVEYRFSPPEEGRMQARQGFDIVASMSSLISRVFLQGTSKGGAVAGINLNFEPGRFGQLIPDNYESSALPLWQLTLSAKAL